MPPKGWPPVCDLRLPMRPVPDSRIARLIVLGDSLPSDQNSGSLPRQALRWIPRCELESHFEYAAKIIFAKQGTEAAMIICNIWFLPPT